MLWPIMGSPREPGGTLFAELLLLTRRSKMGKRNKKKVKRVVMAEEGSYALTFDYPNYN